MQVPTLPHTRRLQTGHLEMLQTFSTSAACHTKSCAFVRDGRLWLQNLLATLWTSNTSCITMSLNTTSTAAIFYHFKFHVLKIAYQTGSKRFQCSSYTCRPESSGLRYFRSAIGWAHGLYKYFIKVFLGATETLILDTPSTICHLPCWLLERSLATNPNLLFSFYV